MTGSTERPVRRRRYTRQPLQRVVALTAPKAALLQTVGDYGVVSLPQLAALVGPSAKSVRRHLRQLFDAGLVEVIAVPRVALVEPARGLNDPSLLYGSAPNLYSLTRTGLAALGELGLAEGTSVRPERYGPRNGLFLAHELMVRDVRVWFELSARVCAGHALERWEDGAAARLDLGAAGQLHPDAWMVYRLGPQRLAALLEVDRGTERNGQRWREKLAAYGALFQNGRLQAVTGQGKARVLVVAPDARRRDQLATLVAERASPELAGRFWFAAFPLLDTPGVGRPGWRRPGRSSLEPLLPPEPARERQRPDGNEGRQASPGGTGWVPNDRGAVGRARS
jgi:DNA-binding transcriptional ArsR family regulator